MMMFFRAVLCTLALGVNLGVAFQAPVKLTSRTAPLKARIGSSRNAIGEERDPYSQQRGRSLNSGGPLPRFGTNTAEPRPTRRAQQLLNNQRPPAQYFGATFAPEAPAPVALPTSEELRIQIDVEKSKGTKDYNRLGQLTSQLQAREALDDQANVLQTELQAAEGREDYTRCQELQEQLQNLEMSMSGATAYSTDQGQGAPSTSGYASYHPSYSNDYYTRGPEVTTSDMDYYGGGGLVRAPYAYGYGPYAGSYGVSARSADIAMRTRGAFHGGGYGGYGMPLGYGGSVGGLNYGSGYSYGRDYYGYGNVY